MEKIYEYNTTNCKILRDEDLLILDETAYFYAIMHDESSDLRKEDKIADYETKIAGKINKKKESKERRTKRKQKKKKEKKKRRGRTS